MTSTTPRTQHVTPAHGSLQEVQIALDHAREWVRLHADQRLRAMNFWLITVAFLTTAYSTTFAASIPLTVAIAAAGVLVTVGFRRMERRTKELVKLGEGALKPLEARLARDLAIPELELSQRGDSPVEPFTSYSKVIGFLQSTALIAFTTALLIPTYLWLVQ